MKKITILLVIIFTFLFSTTSWGEWTFVTKEKIDSHKLYYEKDRLRKSEKYIYFWMLIDYSKPDEMGFLSKTTYVELDCSIFRVNTLKTLGYKKSMGEGIIEYSETPRNKFGNSGYSWDYPSPNTVFEIMFNKICEEHQ